MRQFLGKWHTVLETVEAYKTQNRMDIQNYSLLISITNYFIFLSRLKCSCILLVLEPREFTAAQLKYHDKYVTNELSHISFC